MDEFELELKTLVNDVITSIHTLMSGVNVYFLESIIGILHRKIMKHPYYVRWVVKKLFNCDMLTSGKFTKLLEENKMQITPENILGYYRYEFQYELKRNKSIVAKQINDLHSTQQKLDKFIKDYNENYQMYYSSKLSMLLDKEDLFKYIQQFLRV